MKKEIRTIIASLFVFGLSSEGAVSVTASRTYVDSRTSLSPVTDNGQVVGFKLGIHTNGNEVLAAKSYVDNSTPGDYAAVSNAAISAAAQTNDFLRKTGGTMTGTISMSSGSRLHFDESSGGNGPLGAITSGSTNLTARAEMENYVTNITSKINDEIDYTTENTQLVSTIESVAPVPGNYTVVSNAAMTARSKTDMSVYTNGIRFTEWKYGGLPEGRTVSAFSYIPYAEEWEMTLDNNIQGFANGDFNATNLNVLFYSPNEFVVTARREMQQVVVEIGDRIAQVSQIPVVPQGIVTTNASGTLEVQGGQLRIAPSSSAVYNPDSARVIIGGYSEGSSPDRSAATLVVGETNNNQLYSGRVIINGGGSYLQDPIIIAGGWSDADDHEPTITVSGTNIIPIVFGAARKSDIDYTANNTQLVATIEATAPAPGNYQAVSNAAMRARSMTDLSYNGIVTNDFWDVTGGVSVRLYRKQISGGADYWESQDGVWGLAYAGYDWLFGQSQNPVYIYEPADAVSLSCTIGGTAYFLTRVSGKSGMIALTNDIKNVVTSILSETLDSYATKEYADSAPSSIVTKAYIQEKLEVYLYIGQDGGVYVRMLGN